MKTLLFFLALFSITTCIAQTKSITGYYGNYGYYQLGVSIHFKEDSTFKFVSASHPVFFTDNNIFHEKGKWSVSGDTIILNPQASPKRIVDIDFQEEEIPGDTKVTLTFNHVKRYFDSCENLIHSETVHIDHLTFAINNKKKTTVATYCPHRNVPYRIHISKEIITKGNTIIGPRPKVELKSISIGCYEAQQTKEFLIRNPKSTRFTYTVYSNYYKMPTLRQQRLLIKNNKTLLHKQKFNWHYSKNKRWWENKDYRIKRFTPDKTMREEEEYF